jgi:DNA polymerase III delta prime subunit
MEYSMDTNIREFLFAQKYRPKKVEDCIIPTATKNVVRGMLDKGEITHVLFTGGPGMGKTTLAYAIANELGSDILYINASMDNGIDVLRTKIQAFASTMSLSDTGPKLVILDEADGATPQFQAGLKGFLEAFSSNCRFIFTANVKHKIIEPIQSRCTIIDFSIDPQEKPKIAAQFYRRVTNILDLEKIEYEPKVVAKLVEKNFPDFRKTLNELQRFGAAGKIDSSILVDHTSDNIKELVGYLKEKDFKNTRIWVGKNEDLDATTIFRGIYDVAINTMKPDSLPELVVILADYGYKSVFCIDQQVNTTAACVEIMMRCEW